MKCVLLLLTVLVGTPVVPSVPARVTFTALTKVAYLQAQKSQIVTKPHITFPLKKEHGRIVIPTAKGRKVFADITIDEAAIKKGHGEDESTTYTYLGYLTDFHCHLIEVQFYETRQWILLDTSGQKIELWGEPVYAPDMKHLVATCMGLEYGGGQPNIIQLVTLENGNLRETWSLQPKDWEPYRICWTSNATLLLSKEMWTGKNPGNTFTYSKLTINP
jgi:hypothetical protein